MSNRKRPTKVDEHASSKKRSAPKKAGAATRPSRPRRWSVGQQIAFLAILIPVLGGCATAVFANWDKLTKTEEASVSQSDPRITFFEHRKEASLAIMDAAKASVDEAAKAIRTSSTDSAEQQAAANAADDLKATIETHRPRVEKVYEWLQDAVKKGDAVQSDLYQQELQKELIDLQKSFDNKLEPTPLKKHMETPTFGNQKPDPLNPTSSSTGLG